MRELLTATSSFYFLCVTSTRTFIHVEITLKEGLFKRAKLLNNDILYKAKRFYLSYTKYIRRSNTNCRLANTNFLNIYKKHLICCRRTCVYNIATEGQWKAFPCVTAHEKINLLFICLWSLGYIISYFNHVSFHHIHHLHSL